MAQQWKVDSQTIDESNIIDQHLDPAFQANQKLGLK